MEWSWAANADASNVYKEVLLTGKIQLLDFLDMKHRFVTKKRS